MHVAVEDRVGSAVVVPWGILWMVCQIQHKTADTADTAHNTYSTKEQIRHNTADTAHDTYGTHTAQLLPSVFEYFFVCHMDGHALVRAIW